MLTILHRHRATSLATLPVLLVASLALSGCAQGSQPEPSVQASAGSSAGDPSAGTATAASDGAGSPSTGATGSGSEPTASTTKKPGKPSGETAPPDLSQSGPRTVVIMVKGKNVTPKPGSVKLKKGEDLLLVVITDQDGAVHVHGVDVEKETKRGAPTQIPLNFKEKGSFEVELHHPDLLLTKIVVS